MIKIINEKKTDHSLEVVYQLSSSVDVEFLGKINELGNPVLTKFHRFDKLEHPLFRIRNSSLGVELSGKIGDNFIYCVIEDNHSENKEMIETTLENVD